MPGTGNLPLAMQLMFWITLLFSGTLIALVGWFLKRYIDRKDKRDDKVIERLQEHDKRALEHTIKIEGLATQMKQTALDFHTSQVNFQRTVHADLQSIRKEVGDVRTIVAETKIETKGMSDRIATTKQELLGLYDTVHAHTKQLETGAKSMAKQGEVLKTILHKLGPNSTLVTSEKPDKA